MQSPNNLLNSDEAVCEKLLHLIEEGDADQILSTEFTTSLNELVKHELITLEDDKVLLTEKGKQAKLLGLKAVHNATAPIVEKISISDFPEVQKKQEMNRPLVIILLFFLVSIVAIFALINQ